MISPEMYVEELKDATYLELIEERNSLIEYIVEYERNERRGDRSSEDWMVCPTPDVVYQVYMEYLAALCLMMQEKYNEEYVCGDKTLSDSNN